MNAPNVSEQVSVWNRLFLVSGDVSVHAPAEGPTLPRVGGKERQRITSVSNTLGGISLAILCVPPQVSVSKWCHVGIVSMGVSVSIQHARTGYRNSIDCADTLCTLMLMERITTISCMYRTPQEATHLPYCVYRLRYQYQSAHVSDYVSTRYRGAKPA